MGEPSGALCAGARVVGSRAQEPARRRAARATPAPPPWRAAREEKAKWLEETSPPRGAFARTQIAVARGVLRRRGLPPRTRSATRWRMRSGTRSASHRGPARGDGRLLPEDARAVCGGGESEAPNEPVCERCEPPCTRTATASRRCRRATGCAGRATSRRRTRTTKATTSPRARRAGSEKPATARSTTRGPPALCPQRRGALRAVAEGGDAPATSCGRRGRPRTSRSGRL